MAASLASTLATAAGAAGKEHMALVAAIHDSTAAMREFTSSINSFNSAILRSVEAYKPFQVELFTRRLKDLQAVFGTMLLPVLLVAVRYVRMFADYILSLAKPFRDVVQGIGKIGLVFGVLVFIITPLIAAITALTVVFGALLALAVAISVVGAPVVAIVAAITAVLSVLAVVAGAVTAAITGLVYAFSQTEGGAGFFSKALKFIGDGFNTLLQVIRGVWEGLAPFREAIADAFSEFGDALSALLEAMKPTIMDVMIIVIGALTAALVALTTVITGVMKAVQAVIWVFRQLFNLANWIAGVNPADAVAEQKKKSAFGLAAQGGQISSDIAGMKTKLEEMILAQTGREEEEPEEDLPQIAKDIRDKVRDIYEFLSHPVASTTAAIREADPIGGGDLGFQVGQWIRKQIVGE